MTTGGAASDAARALVALRRLVRALRTASRRGEHARIVTAAQLFLLREIDASADLSLGELAQRAHTTQSSVSEVVARLVEAGLVLRCAAADDARRSQLSLTARGRAVVADSPPSMPERLLAALDAMPAPQRRTLVEGLEAWISGAGLGAAPAPMFFEKPARRSRRAD